MQWSPARTGAVAAVLLALGAALYVPLVSTQKAENSRLSRLVVAKPPAGFNPKPTAANPVPPSSSQFLAVKVAGRTAPDETGSYSVEWTDSNGATAGTNALSLVASVLPNASDAAKVQAEARSAYTSKTSLKSASYTYAGSVAVPSIPGASAAFFTPASLTNPPLVVVVFQVGRAQVTEFIGIPGAKQAIEAEAVSFARTEYDHLRAVLPGFSLSVTTYPLTASIVYWIVVVVLVAAVVIGPIARRRAVEHRRLLAERARAQHKTVRGSKIAKRQAARRR